MTNIGSEAQRNWGEIANEHYNFDTKEQRIAALEKVSLPDVQALFRTLFTEPRRLNVKIYSHKHFDDSEKREESA